MSNSEELPLLTVTPKTDTPLGTEELKEMQQATGEKAKGALLELKQGMQAHITTDKPITFDEAMAELYAQYNYQEPIEDLSRQPLRNWLTRKCPYTSMIQWEIVLEGSDELYPILFLTSCDSKSTEKDKILGHFFYRDNEYGIADIRIEEGYKGNLTPDEERELATIFARQDQHEGVMERKEHLLWTKKFPLSPSERSQRKVAAHNLIQIRNFLSMEQAITPTMAMAELNDLYTLQDDDYLSLDKIKVIRRTHPSATLEFDIFQDVEGLPAVISITKFSDQSFEIILFPKYVQQE